MEKEAVSPVIVSQNRNGPPLPFSQFLSFEMKCHYIFTINDQAADAAFLFRAHIYDIINACPMASSLVFALRQLYRTMNLFCSLSLASLGDELLEF